MEIEIAVLGPKDTFSDYAAQKFLKNHPEISAKISYHKTIRKVFEELAAKNCEIAVVPIENKSQGFVEMTVSGLKDFSVRITEELTLAVQFSFLSKTERSKIKKIFVHPIAKGQCSQFLQTFSDVEIVYTDSNMASFEKLRESDCCGAIVPSHIFEANVNEYEFCVQNISDNPDNSTRFIVLRNSDEKK